MRAFVLPLLILGLSGCSIIYKLPTRQGNVIEQKDLDKLKLGMTHEQVKFVLGTAIASTPFRTDRWDYVGYYKSPRGDVTTRTVTLFFDKDSLSRMDGVTAHAGDQKLSSPDTEAVFFEEKKNKAEDRQAGQPSPSADPGVINAPEQQP